MSMIPKMDGEFVGNECTCLSVHIGAFARRVNGKSKRNQRVAVDVTMWKNKNRNTRREYVNGIISRD